MIYVLVKLDGIIKMKLKAKTDTLIKVKPKQSSLLKDTQFLKIPKGTEIDIQQVTEIEGHLSFKTFLWGEHFVQQSQDSPIKNDLEIELIKAVDFTKKHEGMVIAAYADPLHGWGVPTIGMGTTVYPNGTKVKQGDRITESQAYEYAMDFLKTQLRPQLTKIPTWDRMNVNQRVALYSFGYNLGAGFYKGRNFTSITAVCDSPERWDDQAWVTAQFVKYRNPGSNVEAGLRRRRIEEAELFCS